jgi:mono/diheme cytochrome c family protein
MKRLLAVLTLSLICTGCRGSDSGLPDAYRRLEVPEARLRSPEARTRGRALFVARCALCHGERGDGRGIRSSGFAKPPADFTDPTRKDRARPRRVFFVIREGLRGTPMPAWRSLGEDETWDLTAYVLSLGPTPIP